MNVKIIDIYHQYLTSRPRDFHKGLAGHVLIIGGAPGMNGAVRLAGEAALRVGAGLVTIATHPSHAAFLNANRPELMCEGISKPKELVPLLAKAKVIVLGVGLGQLAWSRALWERAMTSHLPLIVDADGLNLLAKFPRYAKNWILTPHPGEAARLLQQSHADIQADREKAATAICKRYQGICALKGAGTLVVSAHDQPYQCEAGNPGMATAGMGDILSGVIAGLIAQDVPLFEATALGVYLHAKAGDRAAKISGERGMIASDLFLHLHALSNHADC